MDSKALVGGVGEPGHFRQPEEPRQEKRVGKRGVSMNREGWLACLGLLSFACKARSCCWISMLSPGVHGTVGVPQPGSVRGMNGEQ